jgi:hypothetical protein
MRYIINIRKGNIEFEGIGKLNLEDVLLDLGEFGLVRADYVLVKFLHHTNGRPLTDLSDEGLANKMRV